MLQDKIPEFLEYINEHQYFINSNAETLDISNGNLLVYVLKVMKETLSPEYYEAVKARAVPINVLTRLMDKSAKAYEQPPIRVTENESDQELVEYYVDQFCLDSKMNSADEYSFLFKGYALEPFMHQDNPKLRVMPFDRFLPYSDDVVDPSYMNVFLKFMGKKPISVKKGRKIETQLREVFFAYSEDEFVAFDSFGEVYEPAMIDNEGENPVNIIPVMYANRSRNNLIPTQDSDTLSLSKVIPVFLSDLSGTIMYQCFSIIYGVDIDMENIKWSPNAIMSLKSDAASDKAPQVGILKPEADIDKVMKYIMDVFVFWMETRGIKAGSVGDLNAGNLSSGIAKALDEMDTTSIIQRSINNFTKEEPAFWQVLKHVHNYWVKSGQLVGKQLFTEDFSVSVEFDAPIPIADREKEFRTIKSEVDSGYETVENALKKLYPRLGDTELDERINHYNDWNLITQLDEESNGMDANKDNAEKGL